MSPRRSGFLLWIVCLAILGSVGSLLLLTLAPTPGAPPPAPAAIGLDGRGPHLPGAARLESPRRARAVEGSADSVAPGVDSADERTAQADQAGGELGIRGRVFDAQGQPAADCRVLATAQQGGRWVACDSGEDGGFLLEGLAEGSYELSAWRPEQAGGLPPQSVEAGREDVVLVLGPAGGISGTVHWSGSLPACMVNVAARGGQVAGSSMVFGGAEGSGFYQVVGLDAGEYEVMLQAFDLALTLRRTVLVPVDEIVTCDFDDSLVIRIRGWLRGLPAGGGEGQALTLSRVEPDGLQESGRVLVGADGSFSAALEGAGDYVLRSTGRFPIPLHVGDEEAPLELQLPAGELHGRVVRADGSRPEGVRLLLARRAEGLRDARAAETRSDASGEFAFSALPAGTYDLFADSLDDARGSVDGLALAEDEVLRDVLVTIRRGGVLVVDVREPDGRPALATSVWCEDDHGFFFPVPGTETPGRHRLEDMGLGGYALVAGSSLSGLAARSRIGVGGDGDSELEVVLPGDQHGTRMQLSVADAVGAPIPRALVQVRVAGGQRLPDVTGDFSRTSVGNWTDAQGMFTSAPYPAGAYDIVVTAPDGAQQEVHLVAPGTGVPLEARVGF